VSQFLRALREYRLKGKAGTLIADVAPDRCHSLFLRARALARSGAFDEAALLFSQAVDIDSTFEEAWEGWGEALDAMGERALSMEKYEAARKLRAGLRPGAPDRHFVLRQRGHFAAEISAYDAVVRSLTENTLPYLARGNAYLASGQAERALADYERALRRKPAVPEITALKGEALAMLGRHSDALQAFDAAIAARPKDAEILGGRAIVRIAMGLIEEADADWRRQLQLLQGRPSACACIALRMADYGAALLHLEQALVEEPGDPYWLLYYLAAQRRQGEPFDTTNIPAIDVWPGPLLALHAGRLSSVEVLKLANTDGRHAEATFQFGVLAFAQDPKAARSHWQEIIDRSGSSLIEYAAARHELARPQSSKAS
jgi:tetratricopeptide (TPR) repeat protein